MKKESDAILLRIFIGESDKYKGVPLAEAQKLAREWMEERGRE